MGMKQRLGVALAMLGNPDLLILDEPTAGLDPKERVYFRNLISGMSRDKIIIISTHIVSDLEAVASEVILLKKGVVLDIKTPTELLEQLNGKVWSVTVPDFEETEWTRTYPCSNVICQRGNSILRLISDRKPHPSAISVPPNMEDMYLKYLGK